LSITDIRHFEKVGVPEPEVAKNWQLITTLTILQVTNSQLIDGFLVESLFKRLKGFLLNGL